MTAVLVAIILAAGAAAAGYAIGNGFRYIKSTDRYVNVRGLSERAVTADTAHLEIGFSHSGNSVAAIFPEMSRVQAQAQAFLRKEGIKDDEITLGQWASTHTPAEAIKSDPSLPRYSVSGSIEVSTRNIAAVQNAYQKLNDLRSATAGDIADAQVVYKFTGIGPLRAEMIAAATKDARNAALQFAADSGSKVGSIRNASQGIFEITAAGQDNDDPKDIHKNVRVVTTVNYELKD